MTCWSATVVGDGDGVGGVVADGAALRVIAAAGAGVFVDLDDEIEIVVFHGPVAIGEHLREFVGGIDVEERVGDVAAEGFFRKPDEDIGVLAHAPGHADVFEVVVGLPDDEDALGFERVELGVIGARDFCGEECGAPGIGWRRVKSAVGGMVGNIHPE
jgi:hypothetical protein